jgi:hypothetical protein
MCDRLCFISLFWQAINSKKRCIYPFQSQQLVTTAIGQLQEQSLSLAHKGNTSLERHDKCRFFACLNGCDILAKGTCSHSF